MAVLIAAIWFWVAAGFWNVRAYAWSFGNFIALFTVLFGFFAAPRRVDARGRVRPDVHRVRHLLLPELPGRPGPFMEHELALMTPEQRAAMQQMQAAQLAMAQASAAGAAAPAAAAPAPQSPTQPAPPAPPAS